MIVYDHSRAVWTILLCEKSEAPNTLKRFLAFVERQFEKRVKVIRSDNGTEFTCLRNCFGELGIVHQVSCVDLPQQNGRVERKHRHILNVARALICQASLPVCFWVKHNGGNLSYQQNTICCVERKVFHMRFCMDPSLIITRFRCLVLFIF